MAGPALAQPQGPVVVLQFSGVGAEPARDAVIESLQGQGVDFTAQVKMFQGSVQLVKESLGRMACLVAK